MGKAIDPNLALAEFRRQFQKSREDEDAGKFQSSDYRRGLALDVMTKLDEHLSRGGATPSDWLHVPETSLNHVWVDPSELLNCCMRELLKLKDDPDKHANGKWIQCSRCATYIVHKDGIWKWGLPPKENETDYSKMVPFLKLEEVVYRSNNDDEE